MSILCEKSVAGMNGLNIRDFGGGNDVGDIQIRFGRRRIADADGLVSQFQVSGIAIGGGIDDGNLDTHLATGADDPQRNLTSIGDKNLGKPASPSLTRKGGCPNSTPCPP